ncbi:uncharacterized protein VP01_242g4 [Puccinia sorghi]|uniref:Integrase zinc-binding domain-containing protein n=1 Tax=Puccinia sorghi TaxID=27349 RepID=A0A0L6V6L7_9BASI|nr:uncharacterized protein VP01_242g4 [Puccinia sorghi]
MISLPSPPCEIWTDTEIVDAVWKAGPADQDYILLLDSVKSPSSRRLNPKLAKYMVENNLLFHGHRIFVPRNLELGREIIQSHHNSKLAGHPGHQDPQPSATLLYLATD